MNLESRKIDVPPAQKTIDLINERIPEIEGINGYAISTADIEKIKQILRDNRITDKTITKLISIAELNNNSQSDAIGVSIAYGAGNLLDEIRSIVRPNTPNVHIPIPCDTAPKLILEHFPSSPQARATLGEAGAIAENNRVFGEAVIHTLSDIKDRIFEIINHGTAVVADNEAEEKITVKPLAESHTSVYQNLISLPNTNIGKGGRHGIFIVLKGEKINTAHISELFNHKNSLGFGGIMCVQGNITTTVNKGGPDHDVNDMKELQPHVIKVDRFEALELGTITQDPDLVTSRQGHAHFFNLGHFVKASGTVFVVAWPFTGKITLTYGPDNE